MRTFRVTVIVAAQGVRETFTVTALDEWKARSHAMGEYLMSDRVHPKLSGSFVDYEVEEVS